MGQQDLQGILAGKRSRAEGNPRNRARNDQREE